MFDTSIVPDTKIDNQGRIVRINNKYVKLNGFFDVSYGNLVQYKFDVCDPRNNCIDKKCSIEKIYREWMYVSGEIEYN